MEDRYVTIKEAGQFLSVSANQIRSLIRSGALPAKNVGIGERKFLRIMLSDLVMFNSEEN